MTKGQPTKKPGYFPSLAAPRILLNSWSHLSALFSPMSPPEAQPHIPP